MYPNGTSGGTTTLDAKEEVSQTDAGWIIGRLERLRETAILINKKAFDITFAQIDDRPAKSEVKPETFADRAKDSINDIQEILTDALAALRTFI